MKWNATIIVTLKFFFQSLRTDQNSSWKFYKILWSQIESFGLANWTKKVFPRNIPYRERLKSPLSVFFGIVRLFSGNFFPLKCPSNFWCFATMNVKKCESVPPFSAPGARANGHLGAPVRSFGFFVSLILFLCVRYFECFETFMSFCYFWASGLDMAPTYTIPGLLNVILCKSCFSCFFF